MTEVGAQRSKFISVVCTVVAVMCFSSNDVGIKLLSGGYPLHQIVLLRTVIGMTILLLVLMPFNGGLGALRTSRLTLHICRGLCVVVANMCFFLALAAMPLADAVAIFFISPLLITLFSMIFLREEIGPYRWAAIAVGLIGVLIIMRPGTSTFQVASLLPLCAATGYAGLHILTRKIGTTDTAVTMAFYIQVTFLAVCLLFGAVIGDGRYAGNSDPSLTFLLRAWVWPDLRDLGLFLIIGVTSTIGGVLISQAYRISEAAFIAPFEYIAIPISIFWGVFLFGDWPDPVGWLGIGLITASGLFTVWRETTQKSEASSQTPKYRR